MNLQIECPTEKSLIIRKSNKNYNNFELRITELPNTGQGHFLAAFFKTFQQSAALEIRVVVVVFLRHSDPSSLFVQLAVRCVAVFRNFSYMRNKV